MKLPQFYLILTLLVLIAFCALIGYAYWQYTQFDMEMTIREGGKLVVIMIACIIASPFVLFFGLKLAMVFKPSYDKTIGSIQAQQLAEDKRANDIQQQILNENRKSNKNLNGKKPYPKASVKDGVKKP